MLQYLTLIPVVGAQKIEKVDIIVGCDDQGMLPWEAQTWGWTQNSVPRHDLLSNVAQNYGSVRGIKY